MKRTAGLLTSSDPHEVGVLLSEHWAALIDQLDDVVPRARRGNQRAVRLYVKCWRQLEQVVLAEWGGRQPDLVMETDQGWFLADVKGRPSPELTAALDQEALNAAFSVWGELGAGKGVGIHLVACVRRMLGQAPLRPPEHTMYLRVLAAEDRRLDPTRFLRTAFRELETPEPPMEYVARLFQLSGTDMSRLFGVSRQRVSQWEEEGVPVAHFSKLHALARLAEIFEHNVRLDRIPGVVRLESKAFGGLSILGSISEGREEEVLKTVEESFNWASTA